MVYERFRNFFNIYAGIFLIFAALANGCKKDPVWLDEVRQVMNRINRDLETIIPKLAEDATEDQVFNALLSLDAMLDSVILEIYRMNRRYPEIQNRKLFIEEALAEPFGRLRENTKRAAFSVQHWYKRLKKHQKFERLLKRIGKKIGTMQINTGGG